MTSAFGAPGGFPDSGLFLYLWWSHSNMSALSLRRLTLRKLIKFLLLLDGAAQNQTERRHTDTNAQQTPVSVLYDTEEKVCRTVISLPTHGRPVLESDFLVFFVCVSWLFFFFFCICVWGKNKRECVPDTETLLCFQLRQQILPRHNQVDCPSHTQHLSAAHSNCLFHTHKHDHYGVITVSLILCSAL